MTEKSRPHGYAPKRLVKVAPGEYVKNPATGIKREMKPRRGTIGGGTSKETHRRARKNLRREQAKQKSKQR